MVRGIRGARRAAAVGAALACLLAAAPATAQGTADAAVRAAYDQAFQATLAAPADLDKALKYAVLAIQVGDLEGAIGALERMLIFNPDLPRVRLELGVLYYRLGSLALARSYLERAQASPDMPADVRRQVARYLEEIAERESPHKIFGQVLVGVRHQSNANAGPDGGRSRILGLDAILTGDGRTQADGNLFALGQVGYVYDPQWSDGTMIEANLIAYGAKQIRLEELDLTQGRVDVGPRFRIDPELSLRPYVAATVVGLGDSRYFWSVATGSQLAWRPDSAWSIELQTQAERRDFRPNADRPRIDDRDGTELEARVTVRRAIADGMLVGLSGLIGHADAQRDFERYTRAEATIDWSWRFDAPWSATAAPWTLGLAATRGWRRYEAPDPIIDPTTKRRDDEWILGATVQIGLSETVSLLLQGQYVKADSNLPNYAYDNVIALGAVAWRF